MALPKYPTEQFPSSHFLICGGPILFASTCAPLQIYLLHHNIRDEWLLPKGRKDRGEDVTTTAVRETFEQTGYPCRQLPLDLITRAPEAGARTKAAAVPVPGSGGAVHAHVEADGGRGGEVHLVVRECAHGGRIKWRVHRWQWRASRAGSLMWRRRCRWRCSRRTEVIAKAAELVRATYTEARGRVVK